MSQAPRVLVTRPLADARRWVQQLHAHGLQAEALPLLAIRPLLDEPARQRCLAELPQYTALMFVSGNAVTHLLGSQPGPWPETVRALAPGPGTARVLREAGVPASLIDAPDAEAEQFDSESLWQAIAHRPWAHARVQVVRGQGEGESGSTGRDWLAQRLREAGAQVEFVSVYERAAPAFTPEAQARLRQARTDGSVWLFSSSEAIGHLPAGLDWTQARALATHPRIAEAARRAGFGQVMQSRPQLADVVASIKSLQP